MSLGAHLHELRKKHQALSEQVDQVQRMPGIDDLDVRELKKEKLRLKEEIRRLEA
ncbi:DUF465 domain-containing protein [Rhodobacterales bacterium HKCCE2091]|nr:DUF465 domain-containing protein [Rhodobacterales bacterium HKCCE2091]